MTKKPLKLLLYLSLAGLCVIPPGCKKEMPSESSGLNQHTTADVAHTTDEVSAMLENFWANYAAYKEVEIETNVTADLNALVSPEDVAAILHYSLNSAVVNIDTTWEDEEQDSFEYSIPANEHDQFTNGMLCAATDDLVSQLHGMIQNTTQTEKGINYLEVKPLTVSGSLLSVRVVYTTTSGDPYATRLATSGINVGNRFGSGTSIPWLSQQSLPYPTVNLSTPDKYVAYIMDGYDYSSMEVTFPMCTTAYLVLPTQKPAHHYFSSTTLMWPRGGDPNFGWWTSGYKPVMTPIRYWYTGSTQLGVGQDVPDCNNPLKPASTIITPTEANMEPSKIMGWYGTEHQYNLDEIRTLGQTIMNYFWAARPDVGQQLYANVLHEFQSYVNTNGGFVALSEMTYRPNWHQSPGTAGSACYTTSCGDICDYLAEYVVYGKMHHYTVQKMTPIELTAFYNVINP